jgi:hypothetical protein
MPRRIFKGGPEYLAAPQPLKSEAATTTRMRGSILLGGTGAELLIAVIHAAFLGSASFTGVVAAATHCSPCVAAIPVVVGAVQLTGKEMQD